MPAQPPQHRSTFAISTFASPLEIPHGNPYTSALPRLLHSAATAAAFVDRLGSDCQRVTIAQIQARELQKLLLLYVYE